MYESEYTESLVRTFEENEKRKLKNVTMTITLFQCLKKINLHLDEHTKNEVILKGRQNYIVQTFYVIIDKLKMKLKEKAFN